MVANMEGDLDALAASRWAIQVRTGHPDGTAFLAIVLENGRDFIIVQNISSFEYDGILVIPKKWITGIRNGKDERCSNEVLRQALAPEDISPDATYFGLSDLKEIVTRLRVQSIWPAIEALHRHESSLYIGRITNVANDSFEMLSYNAAGEWEKEYAIGYDEVFKIEIDSKYVRHFNEYMELKQGTEPPDLDARFR